MLEANPHLSPAQIKRILIDTAERVPDVEVERQVGECFGATSGGAGVKVWQSRLDMAFVAVPESFNENPKKRNRSHSKSFYV